MPRIAYQHDRAKSARNFNYKSKNQKIKVKISNYKRPNQGAFIMGWYMNILGTEYKIQRKARSEDPSLQQCDGYCDWSTKTIVICEMEKDVMQIDRVEDWYKRVLRHEIIHAFFEESGLSDNSEYAGNEELVDWIAIQFPKMQKAFTEADAL